MSREQYRWASRFKLTFGKYKGQTIDNVAETDEGLLYLDWLHDQTQPSELKQALTTYLTDPAIARDLEDLVKDR